MTRTVLFNCPINPSREGQKSKYLTSQGKFRSTEKKLSFSYTVAGNLSYRSLSLQSTND